MVRPSVNDANAELTRAYWGGIFAAPYLAGVLGVPEHPRNLGFRKGAKSDFCLSEFSYYYEHPRIQKAIYGAVIVIKMGFACHYMQVQNVSLL